MLTLYHKLSSMYAESITLTIKSYSIIMDNAYTPYKTIWRTTNSSYNKELINSFTK